MATKLPDSFGELCNLRASADQDIKPQTLEWLKNSSLSGTYKIFTDTIGRPVGYVAWADINRETASRLVTHRIPPQFSYEWKEGHITLILDIALVDKRSVTIRNMLIDLLRTKRALAFIRREQARFFIRKNGYFKKVKVTYPHTS